MISDYHRPATVEEALALLNRPGVISTVIGGGTDLTARNLKSETEVVDLQAACSSGAVQVGSRIEIGSMTRLQDLIDDQEVPLLLRDLAHREGPDTLRNAATIGGAVAGGDFESELIAGLLVHQATVDVANSEGKTSSGLSEFLDDRSQIGAGIIVSVSVESGGTTASARTGRTPADTSIVAAVGRRTSDGVLLALTGVADRPILATRETIPNLQPPSDFRGSSEYRRSLAEVLTDRVLSELGGSA